MTHRVEQIMLAVKATLTGLPTTAASVFRGRGYDLDLEEMPGLVIFQGEEVKDRQYSHDVEDWLLDVSIEIQVAETKTEVESALNAIRAEITAALAADFTIGLAFVQNFEEIGTAAPSIGGEGSDRPNAMAVMEWLCTFRRFRSAAG